MLWRSVTALLAQRLRYLMVRDMDAEDYTEHHVPGQGVVHARPRLDIKIGVECLERNAS